MADELTYEEQQEQSDRKCKERVHQIVSDLFQELNHMNNEEKVEEFVIESIRHQHRTLQQNFFRNVVVAAIKDFAQRYDEGQYDLRNEASCKCAKELSSIVKDAGFPFI